MNTESNPEVVVSPVEIAKAPSGITGLDQITQGGLPKGRPTLICGGAGSGKTLFGVEFLVRGAEQYGEPGVFMAFEENTSELTQNVASLGFDLQDLVARRQLDIDHVSLERREIEETGEYDLEGLFIRLGCAIAAIGAKRVVLDTLEALFATFHNQAILRAELRRLFGWLKDQGVTAIITAERGDGTLTRQGFEEYVSDCVILLDHRIHNQIATRRLRVMKYRGSMHGANEYPFIIDKGFTVIPITAMNLHYATSRERISTGVADVDALLGSQGYYRGGTLLVSGMAGGGKTSLAASFANAVCQRGERCLYFACEESPQQILRNMQAIGLDLQPWLDQDMLRLHAVRPMTEGLEMSLARIHHQVEQFQAHAVVVDPVSSFEVSGTPIDVRAMLMRLVDSVKSQQITAFFTSLTVAGNPAEQTEIGLSSLIDCWLLLHNLEQSGERIRSLSILKARGIAHSNQVREFILTNQGIHLADITIGPQGIITGSVRQEQALRTQAEAHALTQETERQRLRITHKRKTLEARIAALQAEFAAEQLEVEQAIAQNHERAERLQGSLAKIAIEREQI